jgi:hypothetical protein
MKRYPGRLFDKDQVSSRVTAQSREDLRCTGETSLEMLAKAAVRRNEC